jgi:hypothetical protein
MGFVSCCFRSFSSTVPLASDFVISILLMLAA